MKWEYCEKFLYKDEIVPESNSAGEHGWELVTVLRQVVNKPTIDYSCDLIRCIFKRKVNNGPI